MRHRVGPVLGPSQQRREVDRDHLAMVREHRGPSAVRGSHAEGHRRVDVVAVEVPLLGAVAEIVHHDGDARLAVHSRVGSGAEGGRQARVDVEVEGLAQTRDDRRGDGAALLHVDDHVGTHVGDHPVDAFHRVARRSRCGCPSRSPRRTTRHRARGGGRRPRGDRAGRCGSGGARRGSPARRAGRRPRRPRHSTERAGRGRRARSPARPASRNVGCSRVPAPRVCCPPCPSPHRPAARPVMTAAGDGGTLSDRRRDRARQYSRPSGRDGAVRCWGRHCWGRSRIRVRMTATCWRLVASAGRSISVGDPDASGYPWSTPSVFR